MTSPFKITLLAFAVAAWSALTLQAAPREKKIFAHYMGCYPVGYGALDYHLRQQSKEMKYDSANQQAASGGNIVNWPLIPQDAQLTPAQAAELEIKRALRGGIDGFAIDAWAGGDGAKETLSHLFAAAERLDVPFELTICLDPACHPRGPVGNHIQTYTDSIKWLIEKHGKSAKLARRNGKVLILGYGSGSIIYEQAFRDLPEGPAKWNRIAEAYDQVETNVGQPIYWHFDFDNISMRTSSKDPKVWLEAAAWAGRTFDSVGGFFGAYDEWYKKPEAIAAIKAGGAEWNLPLYYQYNNKGGSLFVELGTNKLRDVWQRIRESDSTLLQFVTWNDYGEDTVLAPGYSTNYTILSLNRHLIDWWKQGAEPKVAQDQIHLIFRRAVNGAPVFPFLEKRSAPGVLEVATILKAPGTVSLPGRGISYEAPAGLSVKQFPLQTGDVSASLLRTGKTVLSVTAPEKVTDKPFREDNAMVCFSSNFLDEWKADFAHTPPLLYSENGDIDGDSLPNWFEMYYFGRFPYLSTASSADASADPDSDRLSNLEEYQLQSDPTKAEGRYDQGYIWDFSEITEKGISYNPGRDSHRHNVWYFLYKHGESGAIPRDGNYARTQSSGANIPYAGLMAHLSPAKDPDGRDYRYLHAWIAHRKTPEGRWQMTLRPRANAAIILGWQSPITGVVSLSFDVAEVKGADPILFDITRNKEPKPLRTASVPVGGTALVELNSVTVKKGDFLYLIADAKPRTDSPYAQVENLKVTLEKIHE